MRDPFKGGTKPVVILRWYRIKFVIVATRAVNGKSEESTAGSRDHVIDGSRANVCLRDLILITDIIIRARDEESAANFDLGIIFAHHIPR